MNSTIWKFTLKREDEAPLRVPDGARWLDAQMQGGEVCRWARVDPAAPLQPRQVVVVGTGWPTVAGLHAAEHIGTVQDGSFVWHVFDFGIGIVSKPKQIGGAS